MDFETILDGLWLLLALAMIPASFVSKTIIWGNPRHNKPQKITWFGRTFMFLGGLTGVFEFGLAILKRKQVVINPAWSAAGFYASKFILEILFLLIAVPFLIVSIRALIRREEPNKLNRLITLFLTVICVYLLWNVLPGMAKEVSSVFRRLTS